MNSAMPRRMPPEIDQTGLRPTIARSASSRKDRMSFTKAVTRSDVETHAAVATACLAAPSEPCDNAVNRLPFLIRRDGRWLYRGSVISRKEMVCLFASVLTRDPEGDYWLRTPVERGRIEVEDVPFLAVELDWSGCGRSQELTFRTNVDQLVTAGPDHPIRISHDILTCEPTPYLRVRDGDGEQPIEARIGRAVYYELVALAVPHLVYGRRMLGVWSCDRFFPLGELPPGED